MGAKVILTDLAHPPLASRKFPKGNDTVQSIFGCAAMIAAVAFAIGLIVSFSTTASSFPERFALAGFTAVIAFVAAVLLMYRDHFRHAAARRAVRRQLLARADIADQPLSTHSSDSALELIAQTRAAIATFFDVPIEKVSADDNLRQDLNFDALEPAFHTFFVYHVLSARNLAPQSFTFHTAQLVTVRDLAREAGRVIDNFNHRGTREDTQP